MQAIVVTFDRLATRLLGCYGNEWIETPNFDRLASQCAVFDDHFVDTVGPAKGQAWFSGTHALHRPGASALANASQMLRAAGVATQGLVSDQASIRSLTQASFDNCRTMDGTDGLDANPGDVSFARLVQAGIAALHDDSSGGEKRLLWLHAPEPGLPPEGFATLYFEDFAERGMPMADIPREDWGNQFAVAAGSTSLVDHWLGVLCQEIESASLNRPTLILIAAAGGRAWMDGFLAATPSVKRDSPADTLRDLETRSPLLLAVRGGDRFTSLSGIRSPQFVQPMDVLPTLLDWFGQPEIAAGLEGQSLLRIPFRENNHPEAIIFGDEDCRLGIRTHEWTCLARISDPRKPLAGAGLSDEQTGLQQVQLFAKPEDLWDITDISTQQPEVCEQLLMNLEKIRTSSPTVRP